MNNLRMTTATELKQLRAAEMLRISNLGDLIIRNYVNDFIKQLGPYYIDHPLFKSIMVCITNWDSLYFKHFCIGALEGIAESGPPWSRTGYILLNKEGTCLQCGQKYPNYKSLAVSYSLAQMKSTGLADNSLPATGNTCGK